MFMLCLYIASAATQHIYTKKMINTNLTTKPGEWELGTQVLV
jgi:hypothetical protein